MVQNTVYEHKDDVRAGGRVMARGAGFTVDGAVRAGVVLTVGVPDDMSQQIPGGGVSGTLILDPDEARAIASWLVAAADAAEPQGPPFNGGHPHGT